MKTLTYTLLSVLVSLLMFVLLPLLLVVWLGWRAHERRVLTEAVRCDGGEGQDELVERAARMIAELKRGTSSERQKKDPPKRVR